MVKRVSSYNEKKLMEELIRANSAPLNGDEHRRIWEGDWNFEKIAKSVSQTLSKHHARRVAGEIGIRIMTQEMVDKENEEALGKRVKSLEENLQVLQKKIDWLYSQLGV